ncbi:MAG: TlpA family protein disulfide reductase [Candidatus Thiodiazotropha sp. (ex Epidulcina cf. delphinae)]|nr:TlpA family protein disulfide reductase [Candidatus Thiodiazotropha sp. (ex Epidulcina cf. delphinae)]
MRLKRVTYLIFMLVFLNGSMLAADERQTAPDFSLEGRDASVSLQQFKGNVVLLDFWASWCIPCRASFPWMNEIQKKYKSHGLEVIAVSVDKDPALAEAFLSKVPADFTIAFDPAGDVAAEYGLKGMPASYLIDKQGHILKSHIGFLTSEMEKRELEIKAILKI